MIYVNYYYGFDESYIIYMIISLAVAFFANFQVKHAFKKYSKIHSKSGISGSQCAEILLKHWGIDYVFVNRTGGEFSDFFDPRSNGVFLSETVFSPATIAAVSVAAHECGHARQHDVGYFPIRIRELLIPVTRIGSSLSMPLVIIGLMLPTQFDFCLTLGIIFFSLSVLFEVVTLPVEFNASRRALKALCETNVLTDDEIKGAKSVLRAAALTYVAATFNSLLYLARLIFLARKKD